MTQPRGTDFDPYAENPDLAAFRDAQVKEWGEWVAVEDIYVGGVPAVRKGDAVPASNVARHGYDKAGKVVKRNSPQGRALTGEPEPETRPVKSTGGNG